MTSSERFGMTPEQEGFVIEADSPASLAAEQLVVRGRLQVYVRSGSQYATWRQFPDAVRFEVETPSGERRTTPDLTLSISDCQETYEEYAAEPADQIVGQNFEMSCLDLITEFIGDLEPGSYRLRARYESWVSNWVDVEVVR